MINQNLSRKGKQNGMYGVHRFGSSNPFFGKTHSKEVIEKNRLAHLGRPLSKEHKEKIRQGCLGINQGDKHGLWKGEKVSYVGLHKWVERSLGVSKVCDNCGGTFPLGYSIEWANKSGKYHRDLSDWMRLCRSCHRVYDSFKRDGVINILA